MDKYKNDYLTFYGENNISPVRQDINNFEQHCLRRKNLYRQLGIPVLALRNSEILEVGAGSGYNTLTYFFLGGGVKNVDIVEPNPTGRVEINRLFEKYKITKDKYNCISSTIEEFVTNKTYDFVIAEGFIPGLSNPKEILGILEKYTHKNSIIIITCVDEIGLYVERMKRLVAQYITKDIKELKLKVEKLLVIFKPQLEKLGASRKPEDWILDQLFNPSLLVRNDFTMKDAIEFYYDRFEVLGASQNIFVDNSWYKDLQYDYKKAYINQYERKKSIFLFAGEYEENYLQLDEINKLKKEINRIHEISREIEIDKKWSLIQSLIVEIEYLNKVSSSFRLKEYNNEIIDIFNNLENNKIDFSKYNRFFNDFGKSQQYISFVRF